jgi:hypothetical protein
MILQCKRKAETAVETAMGPLKMQRVVMEAAMEEQ